MSSFNHLAVRGWFRRTAGKYEQDEINNVSITSR